VNAAAASGLLEVVPVPLLKAFRQDRMTRSMLKFSPKSMAGVDSRSRFSIAKFGSRRIAVESMSLKNDSHERHRVTEKIKIFLTQFCEGEGPFKMTSCSRTSRK
jgi:hypothetical protein